MASTYSPNLRLELIGTGEQQGTWGTTTNTNLGTLLEEAIGGYVSVTVSNSGDTTLSTNNGSADQSRNAVINLTGTITAARNVICPAIEKLYVVKNATTGGFSVTFKVSGQTGVTIPNGETYFLYVDGIDANKIVGNVASTNATNTFTENQIISVTDNTDAALRITQLGTGNALLVEDSTNPDATPTVIAADGTVIVGHTTALSTDSFVGTQQTPKAQIHGANAQNSSLSVNCWAAGNTPPSINFGKSRGAIGTNTIVQNNDVLGDITFNGDDGTELVVGASIVGWVDGTPGLGDMPSRIVFSTTADGASTTTERMRINSKGNVNIGAADDPDSALQITGSTNATGIMVGSISGTTLTITAVTSGSVSVGDRLFIAASGLDYNTYVTALGTGTGGTGTYTINNTTTLASTTIYFYASSINTLSFVDTDTAELTNQPIGGIEWYGSDASTPGAGVKAYIATVAESASPDTALLFGTSDNTASTQAVERMRIASDGKVGIGTQAPDALLSVNGVASFGDGAEATPSIANFGDLNTGLWFPAADTISVSTGATERLRVRSDGGVGIGGVGSATGGVTVSKTATGGTTYNNISLNSQIQSDVTATYRGVLSSVSTAASAFTTNALQHFSASGVTLGAGSNVTTQYGFVAQPDLTAAGTNIGFYSAIPNATGDWNFYAVGTAPNYFAGAVGIGTSSPDALLEVVESASTPSGLFSQAGAGASLQVTQTGTGVGLNITNTGTGDSFVVEDSASPDATPFVIDSSGRVISGHTAALSTFDNSTTNPTLQKIGTTTNTSGFGMAGFNATPRIFIARSANASVGSYTAVAADVLLGSVNAYGSDTTDFAEAAEIGFYSGGTFSNTSSPGYITFSTTPVGSQTAAEIMRITSAGNVGIATTSPSNPLHVSGAAQATTFEVGNASDTTISRVSAGVIAVEGDTVAMLTAAQTFSGLKTFTGGIQSTANAIYNVQNSNAKTVADTTIGATNAQYIGWNATGSGTAINIGNQVTSTTGSFVEGYKARGGNTTTITAAASGDDILTIRGSIYDGAAWRSSARITFNVDAAVSSGDAPGAITFSTTSDGASSVTDRFKIDSSGDCLVIGTSLLGYGTGSGSSVTQATSRTTGVTINNPVGRITLVSAAGSTTWASFTVTNSTVGTSDLIVVNQRTGTDLYEIHVTAVAAGSFRLSFRTTGGTTTETPTFSFAVISGSIT